MLNIFIFILVSSCTSNIVNNQHTFHCNMREECSGLIDSMGEVYKIYNDLLEFFESDFQKMIFPSINMPLVTEKNPNNNKKCEKNIKPTVKTCEGTKNYLKRKSSAEYNKKLTCLLHAIVKCDGFALNLYAFATVALKEPTQIIIDVNKELLIVEEFYNFCVLHLSTIKDVLKNIVRSYNQIFHSTCEDRYVLKIEKCVIIGGTKFREEIKDLLKLILEKNNNIKRNIENFSQKANEILNILIKNFSVIEKYILCSKVIPSSGLLSIKVHSIYLPEVFGSFIGLVSKNPYQDPNETIIKFMIYKIMACFKLIKFSFDSRNHFLEFLQIFNAKAHHLNTQNSVDNKKNLEGYQDRFIDSYVNEFINCVITSSVCYNIKNDNIVLLFVLYCALLLSENVHTKHYLFHIVKLGNSFLNFTDEKLTLSEQNLQCLSFYEHSNLIAYYEAIDGKILNILCQDIPNLKSYLSTILAKAWNDDFSY